MPKHGKKFRETQAKVPPGVQFRPDEAVQMVKDLATAKFDETVEVATCLNVDPRKAGQGHVHQIRAVTEKGSIFPVRGVEVMVRIVEVGHGAVDHEHGFERFAQEDLALLVRR